MDKNGLPMNLQATKRYLLYNVRFKTFKYMWFSVDMEIFMKHYAELQADKKEVKKPVSA